MAYAWSLATVAPNRENHVSALLSKLELDHRVFRILSRSPSNGKVVETLRPVFPGYLFVKPDDNREMVLNIDGIVGFVKFGDSIIDIDSVVEDLDEESDEAGVLPWSDHADEERFSSGDRVRVKEGIAQSRMAKFSRYLSRDMCIVLLEFMGRITPFTVLHENLELVEIRNKWHRRRRRSFRFREKTCRQAA
jgi:transcription antitermination factor NusG